MTSSWKLKNNYVYIEVWRGMYGLPQAGILAKKLIKTCLAAHRYHELSHTLGLFKHDFWPVWFTLIVDDFGIKYEGTESCKHFLFDIFEQFYKVEVAWKVACTLKFP